MRIDTSAVVEYLMVPGSKQEPGLTHSTTRVGPKFNKGMQSGYQKFTIGA